MAEVTQPALDVLGQHLRERCAFERAERERALERTRLLRRRALTAVMVALGGAICAVQLLAR